ncbi:MAG: hypothetical protein AB7O49_17350 [Sphingomonadales bacterium]
MADHLLVAISNAQPGREDEYSNWYESIHMPEVLALPGFVAAQRFAPAQAPADGPSRYMAVYEIEGDVDAAMGGLMGAVRGGTLNMTDAIDSKTVTMVVYKATTPKITAR